MVEVLPKGLKIERDNENKIIIRTDKKELVFSDYFGVIFCFCGFIMGIFALIDTGLTEEFIIFSFFFMGLIGYLFVSLLISFYEYQVITITADSVEIIKIRPIFSNKLILERQAIDKIDFKELGFFTLFMPSIVIMIKWSSNMGYYKIPRIIYRGGNIYIMEHYKKSLREWIVDFLNEELK